MLSHDCPEAAVRVHYQPENITKNYTKTMPNMAKAGGGARQSHAKH